MSHLGLYFCVLGEHIKEKFNYLGPETIFNKFIYFNHSHVFNSNSINNNNNLNTINLGIVGTMRENKWISSIIELGKKIKYYLINLKAIGRVYYDVNKLNDSCIQIVDDSNFRFLSRNEMDNEISKLDYVIFLYPEVLSILLPFI